MEYISVIINFILGGGLIILFTLKPTLRKANAEANNSVMAVESSEADVEGKRIANVSASLDIWQKSAEMSEKRAEAAEQRADAAEQRACAIADKYDKLAEEVSLLRNEVKQLTSTNKRIIKILDSINHDNLEQKKQEAKDITGA